MAVQTLFAEISYAVLGRGVVVGVVAGDAPELMFAFAGAFFAQLVAAAGSHLLDVMNRSMVHRPLSAAHEDGPKRVERQPRPEIIRAAPPRRMRVSPSRWHCSHTDWRRSGASQRGLTMV